MRWRYTLIDRFGNRTRIDQPVGWDSLSFKLKRHAERHGTFREIQTNTFRFYGKGGELLKAEYEQWGTRGRYELQIEGRCGLGWEELYRGRISFESYDAVCGAECYVSVGCDQLGAVVDFINRFDQKVEVGSLVAFDKTTALSDYATLTKTVLLPSKAILLRAVAKNTSAQEYILSNDNGWFPAATTGDLRGWINVPFTNVEVNNIPKFSASSIIDYYNWSNYNEDVPELIINEKDENLNCVGTSFELSFRVKGRLKNLVGGSGSHNLALTLKKGTETLITPGITPLQGWIVSSTSNAALTHEFDISWSGTVSLEPGEKLWLNLFLIYIKTSNYAADVRIEYDPETFFTASVVSKCDPSLAKLYLVYETASRVTESITNGALKVSSSYYGRTDSKPFAFPADGCGGLRALTTGLDIRRAKLSDGSDPKLFLSMKDLFENLSAIDNIGIGTEGEGKITIENWRYFYQDAVIFRCRNIEQVEKQNIEGENYSVFKVGYDKWETEDYDGLDEFLTKREYRTELSEVQNALEKTSKFIASGYAWETTRRKGPDSKDWRYDNDTFIVCLSNVLRTTVSFDATQNWITVSLTDFFHVGDTITVTGTAHNDGTYTVNGVANLLLFLAVSVVEPLVNESNVTATFKNITDPQYAVETGNITGAANLLDPDTVYNFRISPLRNAMRWFNKVANCYRNILNTDALVFSAGDGNYLATGQLLTADCRLEKQAVAENGEISLSLFTDPEDGKPFTRPERIKFTHPVSFEEYKLIAASPYGLIEWNSSCESGFAWIDELEYFPESGEAKFTLIPKVP